MTHCVWCVTNMFSESYKHYTNRWYDWLSLNWMSNGRIYLLSCLMLLICEITRISLSNVYISSYLLRQHPNQLCAPMMNDLIADCAYYCFRPHYYCFPYYSITYYCLCCMINKLILKILHNIFFRVDYIIILERPVIGDTQITLFMQST